MFPFGSRELRGFGEPEVISTIMRGKNMFNTSKKELQTTLQQLTKVFDYHKQWQTDLNRKLICRLPYIFVR